MKSWVGLMILAALLSGCKGSNDESTSASVDAVEASVESGVTMISGMADEQNGSAFSFRSDKLVPRSPWEMILTPEVAQALACTRAVNASCSAGTRQVSYANCSVTGTGVTITGHVTLTYSSASCAMTGTNSVTRTYNITMNGPRGGSLTHTSDTSTDYAGHSYGGGGRLTVSGSNWTLSILGRHSKLMYNALKLFDVSIRTTSDLTVSNTLARNGRNVSGGVVEVSHNMAGFTTALAPTNLQWTASCCHPTSGTLALTFSGAKTGSATVTFNGTCGKANLDQNGQTSTINLSYCE